MNNKTTFIRENITDNFTIVSNTIIKSTEYSPQEKDILLYLLHLPNDWIVYKDNVKKHYKKSISSKKFDESWQKLKSKGHINGTRIKLENGRYSSWDYKIFSNPKTDIPESDVSENGVIGNTTIQNLEDILIPNKQITNVLSTNSEKQINTSNILEGRCNADKKNKKNWSEKEIQLDMNKSGLDSIFENSGINWEYELSINNQEEFVKKYAHMDKKSIDDHRIRFLVKTYFDLRSQPPKGIQN
jgi:hypothetical protein